MANPNPPVAKQHLATFRVGTYTFCAPAHTIAAITDLPAWTRIPKTPPSILGAVNHRGQVVVVVSLRRKLGLEPPPAAVRSQLIIAELDTGLTGFMVDEVEDVRLPSGIQRHPLTAEADIDIFEAYLVDGDRILLQTTFQKLYDARETPARAADLEAQLRQAEEQLTLTPSSTVAAETPATAQEPADEPVSDPGPEPAAANAPIVAKGVPDAIRPPVPASPPATPDGNVPRPAAGSPPFNHAQTAEPAWSAGLQPGAARPPWYRYALVAALFLVMTMALGAGVWLLREQSGMQPKENGPMAARPEAAVNEAVKAETTGKRRHEDAPPETKDAASSSGETPEPAKETPAPPATIAVTAPSAIEHSASQGNTQVPAVSDRPATPDLSAEPPAEVLRVETETFTLTVERPGRASAETPGPTPREMPVKSAEEIRHIVVRGDTLWDIAAHYLGDPFQYPELARLSRIRDPDLIYPNDVIRIVRRPAASGANHP